MLSGTFPFCDAGRRPWPSMLRWWYCFFFDAWIREWIKVFGLASGRSVVCDLNTAVSM